MDPLAALTSRGSDARALVGGMLAYSCGALFYAALASARRR